MGIAVAEQAVQGAGDAIDGFFRVAGLGACGGGFGERA